MYVELCEELIGTVAAKNVTFKSCSAEQSTPAHVAARSLGEPSRITLIERGLS